jgi:membrane protease YdiL (CAAX protease family)
MNAIVLPRPRPRPRPRVAAAAVTVAAGCAVLVLRPLFVRGPDQTVLLIVVFGALLVVGTGWPRAGPSSDFRALEGVRGTSVHRSRSNAAQVLVLGVAAFAFGRVLGGGHAPQPLVLRIVALQSLAAVAEEAFFRRFLYDTLLPNGAAIAVAGSAFLFAAVHVSVYGFWVLPIDLGAGALLSWQRWASGSWTVPAVTHVLANLLVVI